MAQPGDPVLDIRDLALEFPVYKGAVKALNGVSLKVGPGEVVGVVGESGSGKSVTAMAALKLLPRDGFVITGGSLNLLGHDILNASEAEMLRVRGCEAAMIFQEPMTALNPTKKVGDQITGVIRRHRALSKTQAAQKAVKLLRAMYIADPEQILHSYPFELSGGMRQRVMIALAFSCDPQLLIADEPTTALDVTVQRQVLLLLREQARERGTAILFITHDMAVVSQFCDRVYVMYAGSVVEQGLTAQVMERPAHPYTRGLLGGLPENAKPGSALPAIPGQVPNLADLPDGCAFRPRCERADEACLIKPALRSLPDGRGQAACWHVLHGGRQ
ncbi:ABC transporter ATP-binding protein [Paralcaligenes sp. KSB-10]|uniref:ABC transporter ATP-binding protein n=1 Tax=Paralcaligenes sp. KSB-10 TaxID=2901142 RepID=UPI001E2CBC2A|nr:ABC transporter ATP-binding protein [Paralcaligenes sp. KSB-10]UHL63734.1 ABC transporter ATP-binding protein [Paralcaligenes sp. KSB-10]